MVESDSPNMTTTMLAKNYNLLVGNLRLEYKHIFVIIKLIDL